MMLPLAHLGHWLWIFYVIPVLIVIAGIVVSGRSAKRKKREADSSRGFDSQE
jgi:cytochrome c-type biogenesis protein CcmH/NrfF